MNKEIKVSIETFTPLWTGDADGECKVVKLTGIIGSLRWWFEALVRGMAYYACDITSEKSDNKCKVEIKKSEDILNIHEKICPVCFIFGTTGWKSRFSVNLEDDNLQKPYNGKVVVNINGGNSWHYESGLMGNATLNFKYNEFYFANGLKFSDVFPSIIKILLYLIQEYGMLGAKTSMGYGVVRFKIDDNELSIKNSDWGNFTNFLSLFNNKFNPKRIKDLERKRKIENNLKNLPNLKDMFFIKFKVDDNFNNILGNIKPFYRLQDGILEGDIDKWKDKAWIISSPVIRNCLSCIFRGKYSNNECKLMRNCPRNYWWNKSKNKPNRNYNDTKVIDVILNKINLNIKDEEKKEKKLQDIARNIRHFLMGSTQEPEFSAIQVSHVYSNDGNLEFRIYGWLPDKEPINGKVHNILHLLTQIFNDAPWQEIYDKSQKKKVGFLPSQIESICWQNNKLNLLSNERNIKKLFFKQGEKR